MIRKAIFSDIRDMAALLGELFFIESDFAVDAQRQRRGLWMLLERPAASACALVAETPDGIVGMVTAQVMVSTAEGGNAAVVEDLVVCQKWRLRGIGRALLSGIEEWASQQDIGRLQLLAERMNEPALKFYRAIGWQETNLFCLRSRIDSPRNMERKKSS